MARNRWITNVHTHTHIYIFFIPSYFFSLSFFFMFFYFFIIPREFACQQIFFVDRQRLNFPVWFGGFFESLRPRNDTLELLVTRVTFIVDLTFSLGIVSCYSCFVEHFIGRSPIQSMTLRLIDNEFNWIRIGSVNFENRIHIRSYTCCGV